MKISKPSSFLMFLSLFLGIAFCIGLLGTKQYVNAQDTGKPKVENHDEDEDKYETPEAQKKLAKEAKITKEEAKKIALKRVPGKVVESEIDKEKGKVVWEFEIKTKEGKVFEVAVDAKTGDIVEVDDETDEKEDDDNNHKKKKNVVEKSASGI